MVSEDETAVVSWPRRLLKQVTPGFLANKGPTVPVIRLSGVIGGAMPLRQGLTLAACASALERAFGMKSAPAVALQVNSPGGSPVQSRLIYQRIRQLAEENSKKVYVFAEDVAASGGYLIALAGDQIYADSSSIVGSIGVITSGFGFVDLLGKLGIQRRVYTSGQNKSQLDPFQPENYDDIARLKALQRIIHDDFIGLVQERRGPRLSPSGLELFTGEFWTGRQALELGLIDGIVDLRSKMRSMFGDEVRLKLVSQERGLFRRRSGVGVYMPGFANESGFAGAIGADLISVLEERLLWAKYGA